MSGPSPAGEVPPRTNLHATAIVLDDRGVLITGASGAGKTTLALALVAQWRLAGRFARLVGDDQVYLTGRAGRLVANTPAPIAGLAEARGFGPTRIAHEAAAVIDLLLELEDPVNLQRVWTGNLREMGGVALPVLRLPSRNVTAALLALSASLGGIPFVPEGGIGAIMLAEAHDLGLSTGS